MIIKYLTVNHIPTKDLIRIFSRIKIDSAVAWNDVPCWIWQGRLHNLKYGSCSWRGKYESTHRLMYAWLIAPLPSSLKVTREQIEVDHLCQRPLCCNPVHLEAVPKTVNIQRTVERRTHCQRNHEFDSENTIWVQGARRCRECTNARRRNWYYGTRNVQNPRVFPSYTTTDRT
jgi:hypothetical protein